MAPVSAHLSKQLRAPRRTRFQGVQNILRFNWPFFALAAGGVAAALLLAPWLPAGLQLLVYLGCAGAGLSVAVSLGVSYYVYDRSPLYRLAWTTHLRVPPGGTLVNINAGFDETSALLRARFPAATLRVLDFYNPVRHTEASIRRARQAYPPYPGTEAVMTTALPLPDQSADAICVFFAAHEVRDETERIAFFRELRRALQPGGRIAVTEHRRDVPNFLAYNVGFLHFYDRAAWARTFAGAGLRVAAQVEDIPFVTTFILEPLAAAR